MDRGAWQATVHGVAQSQTRLSNQAYMHGVSVMGLWSVAVTARWLCSQEHPQVLGQPHP